MKNPFSRILALVVALSMLLIPSAFAAERNAGSVSVGNFELVMGEQTISLPVYLTLGGGADLENARGYVTANLSTAEKVAISGAAALENGEIKAYLNGMNYGLTIPLESIAALIEESAGASIEDMMSGAMGEAISPELQESITSLMESAAAMESSSEIADPEAFLEALGLTLTEKGTATVTLFDVEAEAQQIDLSMKPISMKGMMDALSAADPSIQAFYAEYFALINQMFAEMGEEMTIEEAFETIVMSMEGSVYVAENGAYAEITATETVKDGEEEITITLPMIVTTLIDESGSYSDLTMDMPIDGEGLYLDFYFEDFADETGAYDNILLTVSVYDLETEESDMDVLVRLFTSDTEDGYTVGADLAFGEGEDIASMGLSHTCYETVLTEESDSYNGFLYGYYSMGGNDAEFAMDTNLTLTTVPAETLLTLTESINPLEADEATLEKLATDASTALMSGLGVLMQDPAIASILGSLMG